MSDYCISREQVDAVLDMTKFKTQAPWGADPMKDVATKVKSAFTRYGKPTRGKASRYGEQQEPAFLWGQERRTMLGFAWSPLVICQTSSASLRA